MFSVPVCGSVSSVEVPTAIAGPAAGPNSALPGSVAGQADIHLLRLRQLQSRRDIGDARHRQPAIVAPDHGGPRPVLAALVAQVIGLNTTCPGSNATAGWAAKLGMDLQSSTLKHDESTCRPVNFTGCRATAAPEESR